MTTTFFIIQLMLSEIENNECIIIEDSIQGIKAGKAAGVTSKYGEKNFRDTFGSPN